jgi:Flp pilus assembly pilin Flp
MHRPKWQGQRWWSRLRTTSAGAERGQTMAEYATVLGVLIIAVAATFGVFASGIDAKLQNDLTNILSGM